MSNVEVKVVNRSPHELPATATPYSAGMDLRAWISEGTLTLQPLQRALIHTGLYIELPPGYECQVRPRSGLALKRGLTVLNTPGTIDADYRGEVGVILINLSSEPQTLTDGERIAQMVVTSHDTVTWQPVSTLDESTRGAGGFGHTGS